QVDGPIALAVDAAGSLYVGESWPEYRSGRVQERHVQGNWSLITAYSAGNYYLDYPTAVAVGTVGDLYVAEEYGDPYGTGLQGRVQKRDVQGSWSVIERPDEHKWVGALALDAAGNLYVACSYRYAEDLV